MRRVRSTVLLAGSLAGALLLSGCGVLADTTAASVGDQEVSVDTVDALARDAEFMSQLGGSPAGESESVLEGVVARTALGFEIQRAAWVAEAERLGVPVDDARAEAESQVTGLEGVGDEGRDAIIEFLAAQQAVAEFYGQLDPESDEDLRTMYDAVSTGWERICFSAVAGPAETPDQVAEFEAALDEATELSEVADVIEQAEFFPAGPENCAPAGLLSPELAGPLSDAAVGDTTDAIVVQGAQTGVFAFHVESVGRLGFEDAREELQQTLLAFADPQSIQQAISRWSLLIALEAEVDPRYGSGVTAGGIGVDVLPPPVPVTPASLSVADQAALTLGGEGDAAP